jgi:hypothetical protein
VQRDEDDGGASGSSQGGSSSATSAGGAGPGSGGTGTGGLEECAKFTASAEQKPAAMLIVLDMSASMGTSGKWGAAQLSVVAAMDKDVFDTMHLGLVTFPTSYTPPPQCVCDYIDSMYGPGFCSFALPNGVSCGVSALPQVPIAFAGTDKSNAGTGVRSQIYDYLVQQSPISNDDDGSPIYEAMLAGYNALGLYASVDRRILVLITDGGFSCTSLSNPARDAFVDGYGCMDWEHPDNVNALIAEHRDDPTAPVNTFVVGVPGSNSTGQPISGFDTPPYNMQLALSTYAVSGSPDTVDPTCNSNAVFMQNAPAPPVPCHLDLSNGQMFDANALADAISKIRGEALGCVYDLPAPPPGETIDLNQVNVRVTLEGDSFTLPKRSDPSDTCETDGCWDYTPNDEVEILGKTCADLGEAESASVEVVVGCATVVK